MKRQIRQTLQERDGAAMIVVLCIMALMLTLCLSLLYGVSQVTANANRRAQQVQAYQLAKSVSDTLASQLTGEAEDTSLMQSVQSFVRNQGTTYRSGREYTLTLAEEDLPQGCESVSVTFEKSEFSTPPLATAGVSGGWLEENTVLNSYSGYVDLTVQAVTRTASATVTYQYACRPAFSDQELLYYQIQNGALVPLRLRQDAAENWVFVYEASGSAVYYQKEDGTSAVASLSDALDSRGALGDIQIYRGYGSDPDYVITCYGGV